MFLKRGTVALFVFSVMMLTALSFPLVAFTPTVRAAVLYDSGNPTPDEQLVLEYINRARANPIAEGQRLGIDIHEGLTNPSLVGPRPPLALNKILLGIAQAHSQDMYNLGYFSHNDPNGTTPFDRMTHAGYNYLLAGENMAAAGMDQSAAELEDFMMVDSGTAGRPHRVNLLDLISSYPCGTPPCVYSEIGIGYHGGATPNDIGLTSLITEDFGTAANSGPFLLGVVYNDVNNNDFYDVGEGIAGVTITTSSGSYYAVSSSSGGYAIPIGTSGTISVTASSPSFGPITKTVTLSGTNIKLDFRSQMPSTTYSQSTTQTLLPPVMFLSTPSSFVGSTTPGTITACGNAFSSGQSSSNCGSSFTATANLPTPATGWQFDHWAWTGGVTCSSNTANPTSCSALGSGGSLMAVYGARVNFATNPASSALISWGSCNPGQGNGSSFFSTGYGSTAIAACFVPFGYAFASWSCLGGLICSGSNNPTTVTFTGPGTITLNLNTVTLTNSGSTTQLVTSASTSSTTTIMQSSTTTTNIVSSSSTALTAFILSSLTTFSNVTTSTYSTPEFKSGQWVLISEILAAAVFLILIKRRSSRKQ